MELARQPPAGTLQIVNSYGKGSFVVSGRRHQGSILILPNATERWSVESFDKLSLTTLKSVIDAEPSIELLIVGCGPSLQRLPTTFREVLRSKKIGIEAMDTKAACRTYNVLAGEGRRVAAALIKL